MDYDNKLKLLYPPAFSQRMLKTSFLGFGASWWARNCEQEELAALALIVTICSINHWRQPLMNSWRRLIDVTIANLSFAYHIYLAIFVTSRLIFLVFLLWFAAACCYVSAIRWGTSSRLRGTDIAYKKASMYHCGLHINAMLGNCLFYYLL
mmetsp:Transcript_14798/g.16846  ORF Transcript_14798/g.16846 Transcript_14798/m.16846 type:complete len:151 (-) Transcript_14798:85-537(-)